MKTYFTSHDFCINLFPAHAKVCIVTVCIKNVKCVILAILFSCFMAKCNHKCIQVYFMN